MMSGGEGRKRRPTNASVEAQAEWSRAWTGRYGRTASRKLRPSGQSPAKLAVALGALLGLLIAPLAIAQGGGSDGGADAEASATGDVLREGIRNPRRGAARRETQVIAGNSSYGTRQSNLSSNGGGAIYGCRSGPGGTALGNEPCIRANNLRDGLAFEFNTTNGDIGGVISKDNLDGVDPSAVPFVTNMGGMVQNLNAHRVGGQTAEDIVNAAVPNIGLSSIENAQVTTNTNFETISELTQTFTVPAGQERRLLATFSAESACYGANGWCVARIVVDGNELNPAVAADFAFDSSDSNTETSASWESHSVQRYSDNLPAGDHVVTVERRVVGAGMTFRLDDAVLSVTPVAAE